MSYRVATYLEDLGYLALPLDNETGRDYFEEDGKFRMLADLSLRHVAVLAGLGEIGTGAFLVTPRFGPRVRLVAVILSTDQHRRRTEDRCIPSEAEHAASSQ